MKLVMLRGLPGSGKTTVAKELVQQGFIRVNKDSIREMLYFLEKSKYDGVFKPKLESLVAGLEVSMARQILEEGHNVVVDDTNFDSRCHTAFHRLAEDLGVDFEVLDLKVPVEECILRDKGRKEGVGENVIKNMAGRYGLLSQQQKQEFESKNQKVELEKYVVVDMDGTLADCSERLKHLHGADGKKNWKKFFEGMDKDPLNHKVLYKAVSYYLPLVIVSARPEEYRDVTESWLKQHGICFYDLLMRRRGDYREDSIVKQEILDKFLTCDKIHVVLDDRPQVLEMWRRNGLNVIDVTKDLE